MQEAVNEIVRSHIAVAMAASSGHRVFALAVTDAVVRDGAATHCGTGMYLRCADDEELCRYFPKLQRQLRDALRDRCVAVFGVRMEMRVTSGTAEGRKMGAETVVTVVIDKKKASGEASAGTTG